MTLAVDRARASATVFVERLMNPEPTDEGFSVKKMISDGEQVEFLWLTDVSYSGGQFTGIVNEDPQVVRNVAFGQKMSVAETEIIDWMYLDNGTLIGNFTLRVLLKRMPN